MKGLVLSTVPLRKGFFKKAPRNCISIIFEVSGSQVVRKVALPETRNPRDVTRDAV